MYDKKEVYRKVLRGSGGIVLRHVFVLVNMIILSVAILLYFFGQNEAAIFLGFILFVNTLVGIFQDIDALISLEKLQLLTATKVMRVDQHGNISEAAPEDIMKGDVVRMRSGEQIPCDGTIIASRNLEVSNALITGESEAISKYVNEEVFGGSIVVAGTGDIRATASFSESRLAKMSEDLKVYRATPSPIERSVGRIIIFSSIILIASIFFVVARSYMMHRETVALIREIGALASVIVPQGLVVVTTLLFAFGAASYSKRQVLFQEINAAEKLGRIKNLCMDKTGTLTNAELIVEDQVVLARLADGELEGIVRTYIEGSGDDSPTIRAVGLRTNDATSFDILEALPFSSWRRYGAVRMKEPSETRTVLVGAPESFVAHIRDQNERKRFMNEVSAHGEAGKRLLSFVQADIDQVPRSLDGMSLSPLAIYVLESGMREGINAAIDFFQDRGVRIRILSGDNLDTVRAVAKAAGIKGADLAVTGIDMADWTDQDFRDNVFRYDIFARVLPEQKARIVDALKSDGFTAMVGDGANDALSVRKADLGIAMFDGAPATRQLAGVVLMNNSFTALPGAVRLADSFIMHLEIFSSIFINQSFIGLFFFVFLAILGYPFPFTPLNITPINYFTVGMPGILIGLWALRPEKHTQAPLRKEFIRRVTAFPLAASLIEAAGVMWLFIRTKGDDGSSATSTLFLLAFGLMGAVFFVLAPPVYGKRMNTNERIEMGALLIGEVLVFIVAYQFAFLRRLFEIAPFPDLHELTLLAFAVLGVMLLMYPLRAFCVRRNGQSARTA